MMILQAPDINNIYENGGKDFLDIEYKEFKSTKNLKPYNFIKFQNNIGIEININNFKKIYKSVPRHLSNEETIKWINEQNEEIKTLDLLAKKIAEKCSCLRVDIYSYSLNKCILNAIEKKVINPFTIKLNNKNVLHLIFSDNLFKLIYCINNDDSYSQSLCEIFLTVFAKVKNNKKECFTVEKYSMTNLPLNNLPINDDVKNYSNGFVVFNFYLSALDSIKKYMRFFVTFSEYILKYINRAKIFLREKALEKGKNFIEKFKKVPNKYIEDPQFKIMISKWFKIGIEQDLENIK